jgi:hypothetical protein
MGEAAEVQLHSFLTSALDGGQWSTARSGSFTLEKETRYPLNRTLGVPHSRSRRFGGKKRLLLLPVFEPRIVQHVA